MTYATCVVLWLAVYFSESSAERGKPFQFIIVSLITVVRRLSSSCSIVRRLAVVLTCCVKCTVLHCLCRGALVGVIRGNCQSQWQFSWCRCWCYLDKFSVVISTEVISYYWREADSLHVELFQYWTPSSWITCSISIASTGYIRLYFSSVLSTVCCIWVCVTCAHLNRITCLVVASLTRYSVIFVEVKVLST